MPAIISKLPVAPKPKRSSCGRKRIRVVIGTDPETGRKKCKNFTGATLKECRAKRDAWLAENAKSATDTSQTLEAWTEEWLKAYGQTGGYSTKQTRQYLVTLINASLGDMPLDQIRQLHVQQFATSCSSYSKSQVSKIKYITQQIFRVAVRNDIISKDPSEGVDWQSQPAGTHRYLDKWEIDLITQNATVHHAGTWAMLMLYGGLRRGEALALRWEDVDFERNLIHISHGIHFEVNAPVLGSPKTKNAIRDVPLLPVLREHLMQLDRKCEFICTGAGGKPVTASMWASGWKAYNRTLTNILNGDTATAVSPGHRSDRDKPDRQIVSIRAHDLRHTYASLLYDAGVDIITAQHLLGHSTPDITMRIYTHLSERKKQASIDKLIEYLGQ